MGTKIDTGWRSVFPISFPVYEEKTLIRMSYLLAKHSSIKVDQTTDLRTVLAYMDMLVEEKETEKKNRQNTAPV